MRAMCGKEAISYELLAASLPRSTKGLVLSQAFSFMTETTLPITPMILNRTQGIRNMAP